MTTTFKLILIQIIIISILLFIIIFLFKQKRALEYAKRIGRYGIDPVNKSTISLFDKITKEYYGYIKRVRKYLKGFKYLRIRARKYERYITYNKTSEIEAIDFITTKILISLLFVLLTIFSQVLQTRVVSIIELLLNLVIGYYIYDIYLIFSEKKRIKQIENEMLRAIIIMNNAFKAGKSTLQAVEIASLQLPEPINDEFKKIYQDLVYGLAVDTVFERFAKRVQFEEAKYLSSSLTILNKTGGNIVEVFSFIEKTLFDKRKLKEELKNITVSSNMIIKILMFIPFIFVFIICLFNPNYFDPLFASPLGVIILCVMILTFAAYVFFLQKIMKVKV